MWFSMILDVYSSVYMRQLEYWQLWCLVVPSVFMFNCLKWRSLVLNQIQALHSLNAKRYMLSRNWNPRAGLLKYSKGPNLNFNDSNHLLLLINFTSSYGLKVDKRFLILQGILWEQYPRIYKNWAIHALEMNTLRIEFNSDMSKYL